MKKLIVTGGAGFIGSAFVRKAVKEGYKVAVIDKLTYAADLSRLKEVRQDLKFFKADICAKQRIEKIFQSTKPEAIINFAAETHVDRSIMDSEAFIETNVKGTHVLIEAARKYRVKRFIHISTDEVYGDISQGSFREDSPLRPSSPYSAAKACADLLIKSYVRTYSFPAIIIRPCNNYGPWQYPEKLIPLAVLKLLKRKKIPLYARGQNIREWLFVDDCCAAILAVLKKGRSGSIYNLGSSIEKKNIEVVKRLLGILKEDKSMVEFVKDRPGHDIRYSLNSKKIRREIGWQPGFKFEEGLKLTLKWCLDNKGWLFSKWAEISKLYK